MCTRVINKNKLDPVSIHMTVCMCMWVGGVWNGSKGFVLTEMCMPKLFILCLFSVNMCFHVSCYFTLYVNQVQPAQCKQFIFKCPCQNPVNHIGGMLISPDSYDNQKL